MNPESFKRIEQIFHEALGVEQDDRAAFIERASNGDPAVASRVLRMIQYSQRQPMTAHILPEATAAHRNGQARELVGESIGPYSIIELIGEGGFGAVYRAAQQEPVRREVALKIIKAGMDSQQIMNRFMAERQTLAMMEHPCIARVFDAGRSDASLGSRPYFVMELVRGESINVYCEKHKLYLDQRLRLFIKVCHAVQHAHQRGIIHRDLKPSNILVIEVDGVASPKVIDFGIAKAIHQPLMDATLATQQFALIGTPQYMSPEQAEGDPRGIDLRTDIYSMGAVLYELLTGSTPLDADTLRRSAYSRIPSMIAEQRVERPSTRIARVDGAADRSNVLQLRRRLRGDLDWIALKALEKDVEHRYQSALALAEDIARHLDNQPVHAGPPSSIYRMKKFIRRHRVGVVSASIVALVIIIGGISVISSLVNARIAAKETFAVNQFMRDVLTSPNPDRYGADVRLATVLEDASPRASTQFADYPSLEADAHTMIGEVLLKLYKMQPGIEEFRHALKLRQDMYGADDERTLHTELQLAEALGTARKTDEFESRADALLPRIQLRFGALHPNVARAELCIAKAHIQRGRLEEAERQLRDTVRWTSAEFPEDKSVSLPLIDSLIQCRQRQWQLLHPNTEQARAILEEMHSLAGELRENSLAVYGPSSVQTFKAEATLAGMWQELGLYQQTIELCESLLARSEGVLSDCHAIRTTALRHLSNVMRSQGHGEESVAAQLRCVECAREHSGAGSIVHLSVLSDLVRLLDYAGHWEQGEQVARELCLGFEKFGDAHGPLLLAPEIHLARFCAKQGRFDEAEPIFERWLAVEDTIHERHNRAQLHLFYGTYLGQLGRFEQAERELDMAVEIMGEAKCIWTGDPDDIVIEYISLYEAWGKPEKVEEYKNLQRQYIDERDRTATPEQS